VPRGQVRWGHQVRSQGGRGFMVHDSWDEDLRKYGLTDLWKHGTTDSRTYESMETRNYGTGATCFPLRLQKFLFRCHFLHRFPKFVLFGPCLTGGSVRGDEKKLHFLEKKPEKYFVSSRNCRTFALAFGKFSGAGLENGVFEALQKK